MSEQGYQPHTLRSAVAGHIGGGTPSRQVPSYWRGHIPWASVKDFPEQSGVIDSTEEHISTSGLNASASNLVPVGTPLVCTRMAVGRVAIPVVPMAINQDVKALFPAPGVSSAYLLKLLHFIQPKAEAQAVGSTVKGIRIQDYLDIKVPIADMDAQPVIARVLDTLDTAIHETEAIIVKLKAVKQGLLHDLLTRGIDANGELRPPQAEAPHLYKQSPLGWIPKEWELSTIGDQFDIQLGKMLDDEKNSGILKPYIGNKAVQWDRIDIGEHQQVRLSQSDLIRFRLRKDDLLVCEGGNVGRAAIWDDDLDECYYQKALHRLRPLRGYHPRLMLEMLRYLMGKDALSEYISRTSIAHLPREKLAIVPLPVPEIEEQRRVVTEMLANKQRQEAETQQLRKLQLLKSALMDDLLTGRVRVTSLLTAENTPKSA